MLAINRRRKRRARTAVSSEFYTEKLLSPEMKGFALGLGVGIISMAVFPQVRERVASVTEGAAQGVKDLSNHFSRIAQNLKEGLEEIVAEAKFEEMKGSIEKEIISQG